MELGMQNTTFFSTGTELRNLRENIGLSQAKLARLTGIVQARISSYELGKNGLLKVDIDLIKKTIDETDQHVIDKLKKKRYQKHVRNGAILASRPRRSYCLTKRNEEYLTSLRQLEKSFFKKANIDDPKCISLFSGCGGLCYGIKASGFKIIGASELVEGFRKIHALNFTETCQLINDVRSFSKEKCESILKQEGKIDMMIGGPPCQGFSLAGKRDAKDVRNTLFSDYLRVANIIKPQIILMENVRLLTSMKDTNGHLVSERILAEFDRIGYKAEFFCINAKNYGVPQHRERVIFIAVNKASKKTPTIPQPTHGGSEDILGILKPYFTFGDAVSDLEYIESGESSKSDKLHVAVPHPEHVIEWLVDVPEGCSAHENNDPEKRPPSGYNTTYKRQIWNEPGATVATTFAMISGCRNVHPIATRSITTREALRLQSFPDNFKLDGKMGDIRTSIGNAVPPLLAYFLGKHIIKSYIL